MRLYGCCCAQCRTQALTGPILLITVGVLFALDHIWGRWEISQTWPVILIVLGLVKLLARLASDAGHGTLPGSAGTGSGDKSNAS